jgi:XTP/dITP diphosphohydrolase
MTAGPTLYLASGNAHKARELQGMADAAGSGLRILPASAVGGMPAVVEDTGTFEGNAAKKARALFARVPQGAWALADDSGLCVDALGGLPGVESAYYAGPQGDSRANLEKLVSVMRPVPEGRRQAYFICVLFLIGPGGEERVFTGRCPGALAIEPRGGGGFGYDPLFVPDGHTVTLAELSEAQKNTLSHRGRAFAQCAGWLAGRP